MASRWQMLGMALCACLWAAEARAYEDQLTAAVGGGYVHGDDLLGHGGLLDAALGLGLDDIWTLRLRLTGTLHPPQDAPVDRPWALAGILGAELIYLVDVLQWVPYAGIGVDGLVVSSGHGLEAGGGGHIVVGLDYLPDREWIIGLDVRSLYAAVPAGQILPGLLATLGVRRVFEI